jgi:hypothetical protein
MPITIGTFLIANGTPLPDSMHLENQQYSKNWTSIANLNGTQIEGQLDKAGWTFFFMASQIKTSAFGFDEAKRLRTAVNRAIDGVQSMHCNCMEITGITSKSFLGLPYVSVSAQSRHIQAGNQFRGN